MFNYLGFLCQIGTFFLFSKTLQKHQTNPTKNNYYDVYLPRKKKETENIK